MRWLVFLLVLVPSITFARPNVAVAPIDGDDGAKIADTVAAAAKQTAKVSRPRNSGLTTGTAKKLRAKLDVDVVVFGEVTGRGKDRRLALTIVGRSSTSKLVIEFGTQKELRGELDDKLGKRLKRATADDGGDEDEDERDGGSVFKRGGGDEDERSSKRRADEEREAKRRADEEREARAKKRREDEEREARERKRREDDEREARAKKRREDDEREARAKKRKRRDSDDDDRDARSRRGDRDDDNTDAETRRGKRRTADRDDDDRRRDDGEEDRPRRKKRRGEPDRHPLAHAALWLDAGGVVARRTLTYVGTGMMQPPRVGTAAPAGRLAVELYPAAFTSLSGPAAGFGLAGSFERTFGLGIAVPNTTVTAPISNGHYSVGVRYRFITGGAAIAAGIDYWKRHYIADRSGLMDPDLLDMPDVDYTAVSPTISGRFALTPKLAAFAGLEFPLMLNSGPIQETASYGSARILAFGLRAGVQISLGAHYAVQVGLDFDQVRLTFTQKPGSMAEARQVQSATDRSVGLAATLGVMY